MATEKGITTENERKRGKWMLHKTVQLVLGGIKNRGRSWHEIKKQSLQRLATLCHLARMLGDGRRRGSKISCKTGEKHNHKTRQCQLAVFTDFLQNLVQSNSVTPALSRTMVLTDGEAAWRASILLSKGLHLAHKHCHHIVGTDWGTSRQFTLDNVQPDGLHQS